MYLESACCSLLSGHHPGTIHQSNPNLAITNWCTHPLVPPITHSSLWSQLHILERALLKYSTYIIQLTHSKCTIQRLLVSSQSRASITTIHFRTFFSLLWKETSDYLVIIRSPLSLSPAVAEHTNLMLLSCLHLLNCFPSSTALMIKLQILVICAKLNLSRLILCLPL